MLSEPSPGPLLPQDDYSEGDQSKGVLRLSSILDSVGTILGLGGGGWDSVLARPPLSLGPQGLLPLFCSFTVSEPP